MRLSIAVAVLLAFSLSADSATQTEWSEGPGTWGPVTEWSGEFYLDSDVSWTEGGSINLLPKPFLVENSFVEAWSVYSEDFDSDGHMDVLAASRFDDEITWWENVDGVGTSWIEQTIDDDFIGPRDVYAADVDGDGCMDVLGAAYSGNAITWWRNEDGYGTEWTEHTIAAGFNSAASVYADDVDSDGDTDVLGASFEDDDITWWENLDGSGTSWTEHTIDGQFGSASSVHAEDLNSDGAMDVLGAASIDGCITWWENADGAGNSWIEHLIDGDCALAQSVYAEDVDGDGDMDVLGAVFLMNAIYWWENEDGSGTSWTKHVIGEEAMGAYCVYARDLDGDGDTDVLGAASYGDEVTWWENADGSGGSWIEHLVEGCFDGVYSVYAEDLDGDGRMDVLGAAAWDDDIKWWNLAEHRPEGRFESSLLDTETSPCWTTIGWASAQPPGTDIGFQVRSSDNPGISQMGPWSDLLTQPCSLEGILTNGERYVQYRAILQTSVPDAAPALLDVTINWELEAIDHSTEAVSPSAVLYPVAPNPTRCPAALRFSIHEPMAVEIEVFDLSGRMVRAEDYEEASTGTHSLSVDGLAPGVYICRMVADGFILARRFVVIE